MDFGSPDSERLDTSLQHDFPTALRNEDADHSVRFLPTLTNGIPVGKIVLGDSDLGLLDLSRFQCYASEALERLWGFSR